MNIRPDAQGDEKPNSDPLLPGGFYILVPGIVLFGVLCWLSRAFTVTTEQHTFLVVGGANILMFEAILLQALIYIRQWRVMEKQWRAADRGIKIGEKTATYANRAYLSARIEGRQGSGYPIHLKIRNSGNTPANNVEVSFTFDFLEEPPDGRDADFAHRVTLGVIAGQDDETIDIAYTKEISADRCHMEFAMRKYQFHIWGIITYDDIFETKGGRRSLFSFYQRYEHGSGIPNRAGNQVQ